MASEAQKTRQRQRRGGKYTAYTDCEMCETGKIAEGETNFNSIDGDNEEFYSYIGGVPILCPRCAKKVNGKTLDEAVKAFYNAGK